MKKKNRRSPGRSASVADDRERVPIGHWSREVLGKFGRCCSGLGVGVSGEASQASKKGWKERKGRKEGGPRDLACRQGPEAQILTALAWRWHEAFQLASAVEPSCPALSKPSQPASFRHAMPCPATTLQTNITII